jgi:alpha-tubulin suppressor-like RCC1 family protein
MTSNDEGPPLQDVELGPAPPPPRAWFRSPRMKGIIAARYAHNLFLDPQNNAVFAFGDGSKGQLGTGRSGENYVEPHPVKICGIPPDSVPQYVAAGYSHSAILTTDGKLFILWQKSFPMPPEIDTTTIGSIACGNKFATILVLLDGTAVAFGGNDYAELGIGRHDPASVPQRVVSVGIPFVDAALGRTHAVFLLADGQVATVGANAYGQLGDPSFVSCSGIPRVLPTIQNCIAISAGDFHSAAVLADGRALIWGRHFHGIKYLEGITDAVDIACGTCHTAIVHSDGRVSTLGRGSFSFFSGGRDRGGWLGHGHNFNHILIVPKYIEGVHDAVAVACGSLHTLIRHSDGRISVCGTGWGVGGGQDDITTPQVIFTPK